MNSIRTPVSVLLSYVPIMATVVTCFFSVVLARATLRYVKDARRRRQFLLIRRFATAILLVVILVMGFVNGAKLFCFSDNLCAVPSGDAQISGEFFQGQRERPTDQAGA